MNIGKEHAGIFGRKGILRSNIRFIGRRMEEVQGLDFGEIEIDVISSDDLRNLNKKHLGHDHETDILTFDLSEGDKKDGLLLISYEDVEENAERYKVETEVEFLRVVIHGLLHLSGYDDVTQAQKRIMRNKENEYLKYISNARKGN